MGFRGLVVIAFLAGASIADAQVRIAPPEASGVARRQSVRPSSPPARPTGSRTVTNRIVVTGTPAFVVGRRFYPRGFYGGSYSRRFGSLNYYGPIYDYYGFRTDYCPRCGPFSVCNCVRSNFLPPVFADAGEAFGPRAAMRFIVGDNPPPAVAPNSVASNVAANNAPAPANIGPMLPPEPKLQPFNNQARGRAWKFIDYGDKQFRKGAHRAAIQRYRKAAATDGGLGEAHFRQGWAELAMGNLGRASVAFRRGLQIDPAWPAADFVLEELLDENSQQAVFKTLSDTLARSPNDIDARFVLAIARHFNGEPAAAQREFARVEQLTGGDPAAQAFLPRVAQGDEPEG